MKKINTFGSEVFRNTFNNDIHDSIVFHSMFRGTLGVFKKPTGDKGHGQSPDEPL